MERSTRARRSSRPLPRRIRFTPYPLPSYHRFDISDNKFIPKRTPSLASEKRDWEDATCSVCMEFPHNAVLLLCSSHDKGCRPYMCGTSFRHSNCLDQFKKAYTKITGDEEAMELAACPLCRGKVKGWTVVEPAREYLNTKKRSCMQDECSFTGTYRELQKHMRHQHPCARPREVDPTLEQKWRQLEHERERDDVISTVRSSMPRSVVFGDYVIEMTNSDLEDSDEDEVMIGDGGGDGRGISRSLLYFFLREGARLMRLQRDPHDDVLADGNDAIVDPSVVANAVYASGGDDGYGSARLGEGRGERRRRRRRSRGRSVVGLS